MCGPIPRGRSGRIGDGRAVPPVTRALTGQLCGGAPGSGGRAGPDGFARVPFPRCSRSCGRTPIPRCGSPPRGRWASSSRTRRSVRCPRACRDDKDEQVREMSAWALGEIGDKSAATGACGGLSERCEREGARDRRVGPGENSRPSQRRRHSARRWRATRACACGLRPRGRWASLISRPRRKG